MKCNCGYEGDMVPIITDCENRTGVFWKLNSESNWVLTYLYGCPECKAVKFD